MTGHYHINYDSYYSNIEFIPREYVEEVNRFRTFKEARAVLLEYLRVHRDDYNMAINRIKECKASECKILQQLDAEAKREQDEKWTSQSRQITENILAKQRSSATENSTS